MKSDVMKKAWEIFKKAGVRTMQAWSNALKAAWNAVKGVKEVFTFDFNVTADPRKGMPYAAKLILKDGKVDRAFYDLERMYGKKQVTVHGEITASVGEIVETREGGSWKNDYRYWHLVTADGQMKVVATIDDSAAKVRVQQYLAGRMTQQDLLAKSR